MLRRSLLLLLSLIPLPLMAATSQAVVKIASFSNNGANDCSTPAPVAQSRWGTGLVVDTGDGSSRRFVLTASHVLLHGDFAKDGICHQVIFERENSRFDAKLIAVNAMNDLALLELNSQSFDSHQSSKDIPSVLLNTLGNSQSNPQLNAAVSLLGFPYQSKSLSTYQGRISSINSSRSGLVGASSFEIDGGVNAGGLSEFGMSGGVVVDAETHVLGLLSSHLIAIPLGKPGQLVTRERDLVGARFVTITVSAASVGAWLKDVFANVPTAIFRENIQSQLMSERSVDVQGLNFSEILCAPKVAKEESNNFPLLAMSGGQGAGIGGNAAANETCGIRISKINRPSQPWPFHKNNLALQILERQVTALGEARVRWFYCGNEANQERREVAGLPSVYQALSDGCLPFPSEDASLYLSARPPREDLFAWSQELINFPSEIDNSTINIAQKFSALSPSSRQIIWQALDLSARQNLMNAVTEKAIDQSSRIEIEKLAIGIERPLAEAWLKIPKSDRACAWLELSSFERYWIFNGVAGLNLESEVEAIRAIETQFPDFADNAVRDMIYATGQRRGYCQFTRMQWRPLATIIYKKGMQQKKVMISNPGKITAVRFTYPASCQARASFLLSATDVPPYTFQNGEVFFSEKTPDGNIRAILEGDSRVFQSKELEVTASIYSLHDRECKYTIEISNDEIRAEVARVQRVIYDFNANPKPAVSNQKLFNSLVVSAGERTQVQNLLQALDEYSAVRLRQYLVQLRLSRFAPGVNGQR